MRWNTAWAGPMNSNSPTANGASFRLAHFFEDFVRMVAALSRREEPLLGCLRVRAEVQGIERVTPAGDASVRACMNASPHSRNRYATYRSYNVVCRLCSANSM